LLPEREPPADEEPLFDLEPLLIPELPPLFVLLPLIRVLPPPLREPVLFDEPSLIEPPRDPLDDPDLFELLLFILFAITSANPLLFFSRKFFWNKKISKKYSHFYFNNSKKPKCRAAYINAILSDDEESASKTRVIRSSA